MAPPQNQCTPSLCPVPLNDRKALLILTIIFGIGLFLALITLAAALFALYRQKKKHKRSKIPMTCGNCHMPFENCCCTPPDQDL
jgi:hypothetical protein